MKNSEKKKTKAFRTLIRLIHIGDKPVKNSQNMQSSARKNEKQEGQPPSTFSK